MEHDILRHHFDTIGSHLHELCKEIAEVWILVHPENHADNAPAVNTQPPVANETPVPAADERGGRITSRQLGMLRRLVNEKMTGDWPSFEATCRQRFGRATAYLTTKEASTLISELIGGNHGNHPRTAAR